MEVSRRMEEMQSVKEADRQKELKELGESMRHNQRVLSGMKAGHEVERERDAVAVAVAESKEEAAMDVDEEVVRVVHPALRMAAEVVPLTGPEEPLDAVSEAEEEVEVEELPVVIEESEPIPFTVGTSSRASSEDQIREAANIEQSMLAEEPVLEAIEEVSEESIHSIHPPSIESVLSQQKAAPVPTRPEEPVGQQLDVSTSTSQTQTPSQTFSTPDGIPRVGELTLPSDVLDTLIYKHHRTQDDELIRKLTEVEHK